jgi:hypothetical protein
MKGYIVRNNRVKETLDHLLKLAMLAKSASQELALRKEFKSQPMQQQYLGDATPP